MTISTLLTYTLTGGVEVLDVGQPDYAFKCEVMVPFGNAGKSLLLGSDTDTVASIVQLTYPNLTLKFGSATPMPTAQVRMENIFISGGVFGYCAPGQSGSGMQYSGLYSATMIDNTSGTGDDEYGLYFRGSSTGGIGSDCGGYLAKLVHQRRYNFVWMRKFSIQQTDDIRLWCCAAATLTAGNILSYDEPTETYVGVRYATTASDTTFHFMSRDGGATNDEDSGVTVTTDAFYVVIEADDSVPSFKISILDAAFNELANHTFTTNIPGVAVSLGGLVAFEPRVAEVMTIRQYVWAGVNR